VLCIYFHNGAVLSDKSVTTLRNYVMFVIIFIVITFVDLVTM